MAIEQMSVNEDKALSSPTAPALVVEDLTRAIELFEGYRIVAADRATRVTQLVHRVDELKTETRAFQERTRRAEEALVATRLSIKATRRELRKTQKALEVARSRRSDAEAQLRRLRRRKSVRIALKISSLFSSLNPRRRKAAEDARARAAKGRAAKAKSSKARAARTRPS